MGISDRKAGYPKALSPGRKVGLPPVRVVHSPSLPLTGGLLHCRPGGSARSRGPLPMELRVAGKLLSSKRQPSLRHRACRAS